MEEAAGSESEGDESHQEDGKKTLQDKFHETTQGYKMIWGSRFFKCYIYKFTIRIQYTMFLFYCGNGSINYELTESMKDNKELRDKSKIYHIFQYNHLSA